MEKVNIFDIVGGPIWVATDDGQRVHDRISALLDREETVNLSFARRDTMITAFLNAAVGQLYGGHYSEDFLAEHLKFVDVSDDDLHMLQRAIENAKRYFAHRKEYDAVWKTEVDEEE